MFQLFIIIALIGRLIAKPLDEGFVASKNEIQPLCLICQEKQQELGSGADGDGIKIATLLEYDRTMGIDNLDEIENEVSLINSTAWLQSPIDAKDWKAEVAKFQDVYETLEFNEANSQLEALKVKGNAFGMEKEANKKNALKKWRSLPIIRLRIHKIEQTILDGNNFGDSIGALQRIDKIRNLANEVSNVLQDVYNYYKEMDDELAGSYSILAAIEDKLNAKREKDGKVRRSKCFWFFCY
ncbi:unnamed protein product [Litomosoides sigmodontis]|uniref:Uncharacterized protein n=1 Tax=Litomosoides sigmodontis TaxID=42156 RepID=A0A3P6TJE6_LITSI|nr:unnamed protein product [Litomosoides sigmodontis]